MEKEITRLMLAFFGVFSLSLLTVRPRPASEVTISADDAVVSDSALTTDTEYKLLVADRSRYDINDSLSWGIRNVFTGQSNYFLNNTVKEHTFTDTGTFEVRAFKGMKEIACDTFIVGLGEAFKVTWSAKPELTLGSTISAEDLSTRVASRAWKVTHAGASLDLPAADEAELEWEPLDTGIYTVEIEVHLISGKVERDQQTFKVVPVPMEEPVAQVKPIPEKPVWKPQPRDPEPSKPVATGSESCFLMKKTEGSNFWVEVDKPDRSQVQFSDEATTFTVSPVHDCIFAGFDYFADSKIDNIEIKIECLSPTCTGTPSWSKRIKGAYDAHTEASANFTSPVLNKDYKYKVTVRPLAPGKLGYFKTKGNNFTSGKSGLAHRDSNVTVKMLDEKTCVYHLRFTR